MPRKKTPTTTATLTQLDTLTTKLAEISRMKIRQLRETYVALFGVPTRSRNATYLRNELARKVQEQAEGGLTPRAEIRINELGDQLPERWRRRLTKKETKFVEEATARDPRSPKPGTTLERSYKGKLYIVQVGHVDFELERKRYATLSAVARAITGSNWNGFEFFGLDKRGKRS
jgi:hypothetical protein